VLNEDDRRFDAVHGVAQAEQIFGEVAPVLAGDASDQRNAPFRILNRIVSPTTRRAARAQPATPTATCCRWTGDAWSHGRKPDGPNPINAPLRSSKCPREARSGWGGPGLRVMEPWITISHVRLKPSIRARPISKKRQLREE